MPKLILASSSPRRRDILTMLGYEFEIRVSDCDETLAGNETPEEAVKLLSLKKAYAINRYEDEVVLGADTVVSLDGEILGKPKNKSDAYEMLSFLSGKTHRVYTGIALITSEKVVNVCDFAEVTFKSLTENDINSYIETGECFGKAGGYAVQGIGKALVEKTDGDFYTIVGLPSVMTDELLFSAGIEKVKDSKNM